MEKKGEEKVSELEKRLGLLEIENLELKKRLKDQSFVEVGKMVFGEKEN